MSASYSTYLPSVAYAYMFGRTMEQPASSTPIDDAELGAAPRPSTSSEQTVVASPPATYTAFANLLAANGPTDSNYRYSLRDSGLAFDEREIIPIGPKTGVSGRDRANIVHELHRLRNGKASAKRRRLAAFAGFTSLIVAGATGYMIAGDIISLGRVASATVDRDSQRVGLLIANLSCRFISLLGICTVLLWCRYARRPTPLARPLILLALLSFFLQVVLSALNIVLILLWRRSDSPSRSVKDRCEWGIDVLWQLGDAGKACPGQPESGDQMPWIVAGSVRLLVVVIVGTGWFHLVRIFNHSLKISSIVDPDVVPDGYVQSLLEKHSANIVSLNDATLVNRTPYDRTAGAHEYLPPMPERRRLLRTDEEDEIANLAQPNGFSAKMRGAVNWLLGSAKYEGVKERPGSIYSRASREKGLPDTSPHDDNENGWTLPPKEMVIIEDPSASSWNPFTIASRWFSGAPAASNGTTEADLGAVEQATPMLGSQDHRQQQHSGSQGRFDPDAYSYNSPFSNNPLHPDYQPAQTFLAPVRTASPASSYSPSQSPPPSAPSQSYKSLFQGISGRRRTESGDSISSQSHLTAYKSHTAVAVTSTDFAHSSSRSPKPLPATPGAVSAFTEHIDTSPPRPSYAQQERRDLALSRDYDEYDDDSLVIDENELQTLAGTSQLGEHHRRPSGSIVYIRMSDGRLVRKLSTIISERETNSRETSITSLSLTPERHGRTLPGGWHVSNQ